MTFETVMLDDLLDVKAEIFRIRMNPWCITKSNLNLVGQVSHALHTSENFEKILLVFHSLVVCRP